ncbi:MULTISPECIES: LytTR family DNA-binding domain-containing protein [unclassified Chryseobacterium]|uniref:LytR/AlgR family response regulator transcription factor n=1 Tax=unclassified Chryseobacterium TaxID=2593645 RepID=UPI000645E1A5|nr:MULTISPECIES: LytTR family DNA-binding domain-containing protein [unclassified Chryseobacterium]SHF08319.1 two component transcriptional regulator, LytTR family [Chryseobacterium sp. OV279]HCA09258.1 DNA-binding response regulator [Chryseobacterium sp.]
MNIIIIEDEFRAAKSLQNLILDLKPESKILGVYDSVEASVEALSQDIMPDLIFMDIQLSDGLSFEIFKAVDITCPIIFCTAFDQYMLDAFKSKGVDYVLKPFSRDDISEALKKVDELRKFFQKNDLPDIELLLQKISQPTGKSTFLVFKNQKYTTIPTESVAYFYIHNEITHLVTFDKEQFQLSQPLGQVAEQVSGKQFFRINRQYLVNFKAIKEMEHYFQRKILVKLVIETPEKLLINKEKTHSFFTWLEDR